MPNYVKMLLTAIALVGAVSGIVMARSTNGAAGYGTNPPCFYVDISAPTIGWVNANAGCSLAQWVVPIEWDAPGNGKTVLVSARQTAANQISCTVTTYNQLGVSQSTSAVSAFANSGYSERTSGAFNVQGGWTSLVRCNLNNTAARLHAINYIP